MTLGDIVKIKDEFSSEKWYHSFPMRIVEIKYYNVVGVDFPEIDLVTKYYPDWRTKTINTVYLEPCTDKIKSDYLSFMSFEEFKKLKK